MFVDSHAHLDYEDYQEDLPQVLARAENAGVTEILTVGCLGEDPGVADRVLALAVERQGIWAAFGVHPHDARFFSVELNQRTAELMTHPRVLGWGEIGLDYHYDFSSREQQRLAFREQMRTAGAIGKPVIIHTREAESETCDVLEQEVVLEEPGVLHCFTSDQNTAERCLAMGFCLSFGGILSFKNAGDLRDIARQVPANRLLIETDSPYLAPVPHRGKRNEPAFVVRVAEILAELRGTSIERIAQETAENFARVFRTTR